MRRVRYTAIIAVWSTRLGGRRSAGQAGRSRYEGAPAAPLPPHAPPPICARSQVRMRALWRRERGRPRVGAEEGLGATVGEEDRAAQEPGVWPEQEGDEAGDLLGPPRPPDRQRELVEQRPDR